MASRALLVIVLVLTAGAAAQMQDPERIAKPERFVSCWDCHQTAVGNSGPLRTFVDLIPPEAVQANLGDTFSYPILARNAWSHNQQSLRITLDLSHAPSLGFASNIPALSEVIEDAIPINALTPNEPQRQLVTRPVSDGHTNLELGLQPNTQDDLALLVYPPTYPLNGAPYQRIDAARRGGVETFAIANRTLLGELGSGNWTFAVEGKLLPDPVTGEGGAVPSTSLRLPFSLSIDAFASATPERLASVSDFTDVPPRQAVTLAFQLVALATPQANESLRLSADLWAHYDHDSLSNDDNENATKVHAQGIFVEDAQGQVAIRTLAAPRTTAVDPVNGATLATISEAVGYAAALLLVSSIVSGGMFGKASRRGLNHLFGTAKRRVAFHNFLSYGILLAATVHTVLFLVEAAYAWTLGLLWGGGAVLALFGLGFTGALQVPMIRRWGYGAWRWSHFALAAAAVLLTLAHGLLDGAHFAGVQNAVGWKDPFAPAV